MHVNLTYMGEERPPWFGWDGNCKCRRSLEPPGPLVMHACEGMHACLNPTMHKAQPKVCLHPVFLQAST